MVNARSAVKLTKRAVDAATPGVRRYILWDQELKGFGLCVQKTGIKSFIIRYRPGGGRRAAGTHSATRLGPLRCFNG